jgi:hypothetical protein
MIDQYSRTPQAPLNSGQMQQLASSKLTRPVGQLYSSSRYDAVHLEGHLPFAPTSTQNFMYLISCHANKNCKWVRTERRGDREMGRGIDGFHASESLTNLKAKQLSCENRCILKL